MHFYKPLLTALILLLTATAALGQDSSRLDQMMTLPDKVLASVAHRAQAVEATLARRTERYLKRLERQEGRLKVRLSKKDSTLAGQLFGNSEAAFTSLKQAPPSTGGKYSEVYCGHLDSLSTALNFLKSHPLTDGPQLDQALKSLGGLQEGFNQSEQIRRYLTQRQHLLQEPLEHLGMTRELRVYKKQVYYYQAQVRACKDLWEDPSKLEAKFLELLTRVPEFNDFFAQHAQLGAFFALPRASTGASTPSLQGLQTRASVQQVLQQRFGSGANVSDLLQQGGQSAQGQLTELKNQLARYSQGSYGNSTSDIAMPHFRPNSQRTKSIKDRLVLGTNVQSQKSRYFFPVTTDLGLSLGFKLNDKSIFGLGTSYKLGLGEGWQRVQLTHQGLGLRSFVDYQLKGSLYVSGGYEQNYRSAIRSLAQLRDYSAWQSSGLVGLSKRYSVSKKLQGEMKLLWDFLSYQQVPRAQAVLFRVGYSLK